MPVSFAPDSFQHRSPRSTITQAQANLLKARGIEEGISDGHDEHWIEEWLLDEFGIDVENVEDLTVEEFELVLEEMGWDD
jgi:hypothetical protein